MNSEADLNMVVNQDSHVETLSQRNECDVCEKSVLDVDRHKQIFHERSSSNGSQRDKKFDHHLMLNFKCDSCDKTFRKKIHLTQHIKIEHEGMKKYQCGDCNKTFGYNNVLKNHIKTVHENEKDLSCNFCDKKFVLRQALKNHENARHLSVKVDHKCDICEKTFDRQNLLKIHILKSHINQSRKTIINVIFVRRPLNLLTL